MEGRPSLRAKLSTTLIMRFCSLTIPFVCLLGEREIPRTFHCERLESPRKNSSLRANSRLACSGAQEGNFRLPLPLQVFQRLTLAHTSHPADRLELRAIDGHPLALPQAHPARQPHPLGSRSGYPFAM